MTNILIVEDDIDIAQGIAEFLEAKGYLLDFAYNGKQALSLLDEQSYDLVLLDINLPFVDGFDVCRSLLKDKLAKLPVIIMSARGDTDDVLKGFDSGAWDYLVKPFSFAELSARITVNLAKASVPAKELLEFEGINLAEDTMTLGFEGQSVQLHQVGFDILKSLVRSAPNVVKTKTLHQTLWGEDTPDSDPLRAHVYKLRKQMKERFGQPFIATVKGIGYKLEIDNNS